MMCASNGWVGRFWMAAQGSLLVYLGAAALNTNGLTVLVKYEIFQNLVGTPASELPISINQWTKVDPSSICMADINLDGTLQLGAITLSSDIVSLAIVTPLAALLSMYGLQPIAWLYYLLQK